jgi:hypothetical protein
LLFGPAQVVDDTEKKKHTCRYVDIDTTDLWEAIPEFDGTKTFNEFKSAIFKLYPCDNLNTTQTPECTKEKYNAKIKV